MTSPMDLRSVLAQFDPAQDQGFDSSLSADALVDSFLQQHCKFAATHGAIVDPLSWWQDEANRKIYKHLTPLAQKWLAVPFVLNSRPMHVINDLQEVCLVDYLLLMGPSNGTTP